jgi:hypothetical protein
MPTYDSLEQPSPLKVVPTRATGGIGDDVTMDCTKCKAHIRAETLKEVGEWLDKQQQIVELLKPLIHYRKIYLDEIQAFKRGEMPK